MKWHPLLIAAILLVKDGAVHGAGFDCKMAATEVEKTICVDDALSAADYMLTYQYKVLLSVPSSDPTLKDSQRAWLRERNKCTEVRCLLAAYRSRTEDLRKRITLAISSASAAATEEYFDSYDFVADFGNGKKQVLGKYYSCVRIKHAGRLAMVHFEVYFPDSGQLLESEAPAVITGTDGFSFSFVDGWHNQGKATIGTSAKRLKLELDVVQSATDFSAANIRRQYGEYSLAKKSCT